MLKTRITQLLGIKHPIIMGGMTRVTDAGLVAAVSNAGGLGILPVGGRKLDFVREEIRKTRQLTDKPFGVNIPLIPGVTPVPYEDLIRCFIEEKVGIVETAGRNPGPYMKMLKSGGLKVIHKCTSVRHAMKAEQEGVDAIAILGFEGAAHVGGDEVTNMVLIPRTVDNVKVPVIAAGGISDGRGLAAAMALGAEGVLIGTRFLATQECSIHPAIKYWLVQAKETDTLVVGKITGWPNRVARSKVAFQIIEMERSGVPINEILALRSGELMEKETWRGGNIDGSAPPVGQTAGLINSIPTVEALIENMIAEAEKIFGRIY